MQSSEAVGIEGREPGAAAAGDGAPRGVEARVWGGAVVLAALGAAIAFDAAPGVNWGIWTTLAGIGALAVGWRRARVPCGAPLDPVAVAAIGLAILVAWGAAVTANGLFQFFILVACVALFAVATRVMGGLPGELVGTGAIAAAPIVAGRAAAVEAGHRAMQVVAGARAERRAPVIRGIALAVPVAVVFALVLAGADPTLTVWASRLREFVVRLGFIPRAVFFVVLGTLVLGAYGRAARAPILEAGSEARGAYGRGLGAVERRMIVGAVAGVFAAFLMIQATYLFRNTSGLRVSGETYAQYAHAGFSELTIAATLAVILVVVLDRYASGDGAAARVRRWSASWAHWGTLLLIGEVLVVLASALHRLALYESAYGYTMLRLYVQAYVVGVAMTLVLLAAEVAGIWGRFDARRVARRAGVVAVLFLAVFSFGNPEGWVVARDVDRFRVTGKLDAPYLTSLSLNAAPALVASLGAVTGGCAVHLRADLDDAYGALVDRGGPHRWYEWNLRQQRGLAALVEAGIHRNVTPPEAIAGCYDGPLAASKR